MSVFLDDQTLGAAIKKLLRAPRLRCAVAFWGNGAVASLFGEGGLPADAEIICDLTMGGTNPAEVRALGAPRNNRLKHLPGLHAKVYISQSGLIVSSANASNNGIGFVDQPKLREAGTLHEPGSEAYQAATKWFGAIWKQAHPVDDAALIQAEESWRRKAPPPRAVSPVAGSLLDLVLAEPERFRGVGFAFTTSNSSTDQRNEAADAVV